ncbi:hypothetical protein [Stagnimonas aquatica]
MVRGRDTKPEPFVRGYAHRLGYRYRLAVADLPGPADLVFPRYRKVIFVHGCFWHRHAAQTCALSRSPKSPVTVVTSPHYGDSTGARW